MKNTRRVMANATGQVIFVFLLAGMLFPVRASAQGRIFNWLPANDESVRLDPANYYTARTYHPNAPGQSNHVDIRAERPVTIFMTPEADWNQAMQHPVMISQLRRMCLREHVVEATFVCEMPVEPMTLVIQDERKGPGGQNAAIFAGAGVVLNANEDKLNPAVGTGIAAVLAARDATPRRFKDPNDVHIQYYRWDCVQNCIQPEIAWTRQVKEKYQLTSFLKVYGGFAPDHDGEQVSIKIKSPVPMVVAMLPSDVANGLHARPDALESALEKNNCQQRGVQSQQFECTFNVSDGPQSLIVAPEPGADVPHHKKAEVEMLAARCVANCQLLESKQQ
ncbi:MAG: hypothetical protein WCE61_14165 [Candidatus Acidiferrum sp.]